MQPINLQLPSYSQALAKPPVASGVGQLPTTDTGALAANRQLGNAQYSPLQILLPLLQMFMILMRMMMGLPAGTGAGTSTPPAGPLPSGGGITTNAGGSNSDGCSSKPGAPSPAIPGAPSPAIPGAPSPAIPGAPLPAIPGVPSPAIPTVPPQTSRTEQLRSVNFSQVGRDANGNLVDPNARLQFSNGTVSRASAGIIHLGGRAHTSAATTATGVTSTARMYATVLANPQSFTEQEVAFVQQAQAQEIATRGVITGEILDHAFIDEMASRSGVSAEKAAQYHAAIDQNAAILQANFQDPQLRQVIIAETDQGLDITSDIDAIQQKTGLTQAEQAVYRLAGHGVLFSPTGTVDADILGLTYQNQNSLDAQAGAGQRINIDGNIEALAGADLADDGIVNGSSLRSGTESVLDKVFLGTGGLADNNAILASGQQRGLANGRSMQQIGAAISNGGMQALSNLKAAAKEHTPAMLAAGGTMAAATAICPFLGGAAAATAGAVAGNNK